MSKVRLLSTFTAVLLTLIGIGAVVVGFGLMTEPSGEGIGLPLSILKDSPFEDFFIPGVALFLVNGCGSLIGAFLAFRNHRFTGYATLVLGIGMIIWITAQVIWIGWQSWLQPTFIAVGFIELALGFLLIDGYIDQGFFNRHHHAH